MHTVRTIGAAWLMVMSTAGAVMAQPADHARAEQHFRAGRSLVLAGRCSDAVEELRKSIEFERSIGAYLNLGDCHFKMRNLEEAWHNYKEAETLAVARKDPGLPEIRAGLANVEHSSVRLDVAAAPGTAAEQDLGIAVDGRAISKDRTEPVLVEPDADHVVTAHAEGKQPWRKVVRGDAGSVVRVEIALQEKEAPVAAVGPVEKEPAAVGNVEAGTSGTAPGADTGHGTRTLGLVVGGVGLAAIAAGGVFGVLALKSKSDLSDAVNAPGSGCTGGSYPDAKCDPGARGTLDPIESRAHTQATVSTVLFGVGGAALVTGVVLWVVAPKASKSRTTGWLVGGSPDPRAPLGFSVSGPL